jgi:hypothetical protein
MFTAATSCLPYHPNIDNEPKAEAIAGVETDNDSILIIPYSIIVNFSPLHCSHLRHHNLLHCHLQIGSLIYHPTKASLEAPQAIARQHS